jgi:hypothetical protein
MNLTQFFILTIILVVQLKYTNDFTSRKITFNFLLCLTLLNIVFLAFTLNLKLLDFISNFLGFKLASNLVLLVIGLVGLLVNYLIFLKIQDLQKQIKKIVIEFGLRNTDIN